MTSRPRLLLADDHKLVLDGFRRILEAEFEIAGTVEDGRALLAVAQQLHPDVILVDISMPLAQRHRRYAPAKQELPGSKVDYRDYALRQGLSRGGVPCWRLGAVF